MSGTTLPGAPIRLSRALKTSELIDNMRELQREITTRVTPVTVPLVEAVYAFIKEKTSDKKKSPLLGQLQQEARITLACMEAVALIITQNAKIDYDRMLEVRENAYEARAAFRDTTSARIIRHIQTSSPS